MKLSKLFITLLSVAIFSNNAMAHGPMPKSFQFPFAICKVFSKELVNEKATLFIPAVHERKEQIDNASVLNEFTYTDKKMSFLHTGYTGHIEAIDDFAFKIVIESNEENSMMATTKYEVNTKTGEGTKTTIFMGEHERTEKMKCKLGLMIK